MKINKSQTTRSAFSAKVYKFSTIALFALICIVFTAISCKKDDVKDPVITYVAIMNGAAETPPNASTATGNATLRYNTDSKTFTIMVTYNGITATGGHIHKGAVGTAGNVVFPFTSPVTSPVNYTSGVLTAEQLSDLNANLYYVNIHSEAFPGGEIRGQLMKQ